MMSTVDIRPDHAKIVHDILEKFVPDNAVWVFGSRAKWLAKEYSDLDLCIMGDTPLTFITLGLLEEAFEDSDLPYKVDVADWATTSPEFRKIIARDKVVLKTEKNKKMDKSLKQGWIETTLGAVADILMGQSPASESYNINKIGIPFLQGNRTFGLKYPYFDTFCTKPKKIAPKDSILFSVRAPVGDINIASENICIGRGLCSLKMKNGDNSFLFFLLHYIKSSIIQMESGSVFGSVNKDILSKISVSLPPLPQQQKIASILKSLDDKIAINTQINKTLEEMAQAIFKSWFVDFDPVYAKKNVLDNGGTSEQANLVAMSVISGKSDAALEELKTSNPQVYNELAHTASLFPSDLQDSELGQIPSGWGISDLEEEFIITMGQSPKGETYNTEKKGVIFFQGRAEFKNRFPEPRLYTTDPKRFAEKGSVLMSVRAPVGDLNIALDKCCIGRGLASLLHKSNSTSYSYCLLKHLQSVLNNYNGEGTVFGSINQKDLKSIKVIKPRNDLVLIFNDKVGDCDAIIQINEINSQTLSQIRDSLLPKLLSGEIDVGGVKEEIL